MRRPDVALAKRGHPVGLLIGLLVIFLIFMVAGWGWRKGTRNG